MEKIVADPDLDGLVSSMLLVKEKSIDTSQVIFVHPKEAQHGKVSIDGNFTVVDLPYISGAKMWFDHHKSNFYIGKDIPGKREIAPSCARIIANYYGINDYEELLKETDRIDSDNLTRKDIVEPSGYFLLSYLINTDTNDKKEMNFNRDIISLLEKDITFILEDKKVARKITEYNSNLEKARNYMSKHLEVKKNVVIVDMRDATDQIYIDESFKFMQYAISPESNISIRIYHPNLDDSKTRFQVGYNVINKECRKECKVDIAELLSPLGGGGHKAAGGVTVNSQDADKTYKKILEELVE